MSANLIQDKAEQALQVVIRQAAISGLDSAMVFTSFVSGESNVGTHTVSILSQGGLEDGHASGNYRLSVRILVASSLDKANDEAEDPVTVHRALAGAVFDVLSDTDLAANLSLAISDFHVFNSIERRHGQQRTENRKAVSEMMLEFTAVPSQFPE